MNFIPLVPTFTAAAGRGSRTLITHRLDDRAACRLTIVAGSGRGPSTSSHCIGRMGFRNPDRLGRTPRGREPCAADVTRRTPQRYGELHGPCQADSRGKYWSQTPANEQPEAMAFRRVQEMAREKGGSASRNAVARYDGS